MPEKNLVHERPSETCDTLTLLHSLEAFRKHLLKNLRQGRRQLDILTRELDPRLYNDELICESISNLARNHPKASIRLLIKNPKSVIQSRHRLIELHKRLSSKIQCRMTNTEPKDEARAYAIIDGTQVLLQHSDGDYDGFCNTDAKPEARALLEEFNWLWERQSNVIDELRTLSL